MRALPVLSLLAGALALTGCVGMQRNDMSKLIAPGLTICPSDEISRIYFLTTSGCDATLSLEKIDRFTKLSILTTLRSQSGRPVYTHQSWASGLAGFPVRVELDALSAALAPGSDLRAQLAAQAGKPATAADASGVSREELTKIVAAAVSQAQSRPAPAPTLPPSPRPGFAAPERAHDLAVIVGIESYSDIAAKAPYAERDAAAFKDYVRALGVPERNIVLLTSSKAVRSALSKNVESWLPLMAKPDSRVYFYFSGHGAPDVKSGQAYLVPWDGDPNFLEETAYPVSRLYRKLAALPAKRVLVAMDSCFSGAGGRSVLASGARPLVGKVDTGVPDGKLTVLAASASDQISGSLDAKAHGAFTYFLLEGLNAGKTTPEELAEYLTPRVQDEARRLNRAQTPQLQGDGSWPLR